MADILSFVDAISNSQSVQDAAKKADQLFAEAPGHKLFTLTVTHPDGSHVVRLYSSVEGSYGTSGTKPIEKEGGWYERVLVQKKPFLGYTIEDVKEYFPDHEKISAMGLGATLNLPVVVLGEVVGTVNLLDADHAYTEEDAARTNELAQTLAPLFLMARSELVEA
ncbi:GAF domain-containing protein [Pseudovibrio sp. Tun.PSC04-5.I4]|uniref:GAF domain-containing protein n=1 Tax=Pseudovibrio sp. Tun.PSC04-5.I4 TaxID=1798213 RepID=UPI00087F7C87|nr:GAF domain-containing protein [Pseudovibrio sp. Tun.PSC04-5.I4]SDR29013.1 GAF domain-containing protein [Pseudovibrio sp. Tun.PSC04-5.I4]